MRCGSFTEHKDWFTFWPACYYIHSCLFWMATDSVVISSRFVTLDTDDRNTFRYMCASKTVIKRAAQAPFDRSCMFVERVL